MRKTFDDLTITDDYMFCIVMQDKSICTTVLNMVLAQSIGPIIDLTYQKTFDQAGYAKGIRVDVWITDSDGNVFDVEMSFSDRHPYLSENTSFCSRKNIASAITSGIRAASEHNPF
ncbi:MAG: hypothetical protein ACTTJ7_04470 [Treponema sp.]